MSAHERIYAFISAEPNGAFSVALITGALNVSYEDAVEAMAQFRSEGAIERVRTEDALIGAQWRRVERLPRRHQP